MGAVVHMGASIDGLELPIALLPHEQDVVDNIRSRRPRVVSLSVSSDFCGLVSLPVDQVDKLLVSVGLSEAAMFRRDDCKQGVRGKVLHDILNEADKGLTLMMLINHHVR
jgi:hypothetical protein